MFFNFLFLYLVVIRFGSKLYFVHISVIEFEKAEKEIHKKKTMNEKENYRLVSFR